MKTKIKICLGWAFIYAILFPIHYIGYGLHLLTKLLRSFSFLLMFKPCSAVDELTDFFTIRHSVVDLF